MASSTTDSQRVIRQNIVALEEKLKRLRTAAEVLSEIEHNGSNQGNASINASAPSKPKSIADAIRVMLKENGPSLTADIISWIHQNYKSDASSSSIRSILSQYKAKKKFRRSEKSGKWQLPKASKGPREGASK